MYYSGYQPKLDSVVLRPLAHCRPGRRGHGGAASLRAGGCWRRVPRGRAGAVRPHPGRHGALLAAASSRPACFRCHVPVACEGRPRTALAKPPAADSTPVWRRSCQARSPRAGQVSPARRPGPDPGSLRVGPGCAARAQFFSGQGRLLLARC